MTLLDFLPFFAVLLAFYGVALGAVFGVGDARVRKAIGWSLPLFVVILMLLFGAYLQPWHRLVASTAALLFLIKATVLLQRPRQEIIEYSKFGLTLYFTVWPGMNPTPFRARLAVDVPILKSSERLFVRGVIIAVFGVGLAILTSVFTPQIERLGGRNLVGWLGIAAFLLTLHFGFSDVLTFAVRWIGFPVGVLFDAPLRSRSLRDFWSHRWNLAFVEMDTLLFFKPLRRKFGVSGALLGVFFISGVLHELALSYVAGAGWGGPLGYFLLHGLLVVFESKAKVEKRWPVFLTRFWTWFWLLAPLPILFHAPLRHALLVTPLEFAHRLLRFHSIEWWFSLALWLAALGHFCILGASFQVPSRLGWKEDFASLSRFNRKIFWTYGAFIVLIIVSNGLMTLFLHAEMLHGDRAALAIALFIGVFWLTRIVVDFFYFKHDDWPEGAEFIIGHTFLTGLFIALTSVYFGLLIWHSFF